MEQISITRKLDACGLNCPMPLLKTKQALHTMAAGEVLMVSTTDPGSQRDFVSFAELAGHTLLSHYEQSGIFIFILRKHG